MHSVDTVAYLTRYDALLCVVCATDRRRLVGDSRSLTPLNGDLFHQCCVDVYGYDTARCEECQATLYDGFAVLRF